MFKQMNNKNNLNERSTYPFYLKLQNNGKKLVFTKWTAITDISVYRIDCHYRH